MEAMSIDDDNDKLRRRGARQRDHMAQHVVIRSDYPDEPNVHVLRHEDGDFGLAVVDGERWPGTAATLCSSGGRNIAAWEAVAALWRAGSGKPTATPRAVDLSEYIEQIARVVYRVPEGGVLTRTSYADLMDELQRRLPPPGTKRIIITLGIDNGAEEVELEGVTEVEMASVLAELASVHPVPDGPPPLVVVSDRPAPFDGEFGGASIEDDHPANDQEF
jgi:hypothetical protein